MTNLCNQYPYLRNSSIAGKTPGSFLHCQGSWAIGNADNGTPNWSNLIYVRFHCHISMSWYLSKMGVQLYTIWRNELPAGSKQLCEKQGHQDLGTMIHCWNRPRAPNPVVLIIETIHSSLLLSLETKLPKYIHLYALIQVDILVCLVINTPLIYLDQWWKVKAHTDA